MKMQPVKVGITAMNIRIQVTLVVALLAIVGVQHEASAQSTLFNYHGRLTATAALEFGAGVFTGADRSLELGVRTNGGSGFATLDPRQQITPVPYAIFSGN